jgi:hypothetical protein
MKKVNLHNITNQFLDVQLLSLRTWRQATEIQPRDHGGPYVVLQEGYDPADMRMIADEFVLGRSGKWLPLGQFYRLPIPERRAEFVFGTAAEVIEVMNHLPSKAAILGSAAEKAAAAEIEEDEMARAIQGAKRRGG